MIRVIGHKFALNINDKTFDYINVGIVQQTFLSAQLLPITVKIP